VTKEIAYAQYVLRHKSIATSQRYTTMSFRMALSDSMANDKAAKDEVVGMTVSLKAEIDELKRLVGVLVSSTKKRGRPDEWVDSIGKIDRAKKGKLSRDELIKRGVEKGMEMMKEGIPVTRVNLTKVGVNTSIVVDVKKELLDIKM
jgi:hypothetical protein